MGDPPSFSRHVPRLAVTACLHEGMFVHTYRGVLTADRGASSARERAVLVFALAPGVTETGVRARFERSAAEFEASSDHPHVATVAARGETPRPWVAVERLGGRSVAELAAPLGTDAVRSALADVAGAAQHALRNDSQQLLLTPQQVQILDEEPGPRGFLTGWGFETTCQSAAGTPPQSPCLPPEWGEDFDRSRATVYMLGALTQAATSRPPDVDSAGPETADRTDPAQLETIVRTALATDPARRYESPYEFKLALLFDADSGVPEATSATGGGNSPVAPASEPSDSEQTGDESGCGDDEESSTAGRPIDRRVALGVLGAGIAGVGGIAAALTGGTGGDGQPDETGPRQSDGDGTGDETAVDQQADRTVPDASFSADYETGELTVRHESGDRIGSANLVVRGTGLDDGFEYQWNEQQAFSADTSVAPGDALRLAVGSDYELALIWEGPDRAEVLATFWGPNTVETDEARSVAPDASFTFTFDGDTLQVTHDGGDGIPARTLVVRGTGFAASPRHRWSSLPDVDAESLVTDGASTTYAAADTVAIQVLWEGAPSTESVVLDQFVGPGRPLDTAIGNWPTDQYNGRNTGHAPAEDGLSGAVSERWQSEIGGSVRSSPVVVDGTVYVGSTDGRVYALDAEDGMELWRFDAGSSVRTAPAVFDGSVYTGTVNGNVYAIDAADGTEQWQFETVGIVGSPTLTTGRNDDIGATVYVPSRSWGSGGVLHALVAGDGTERWRFDGINPYSTPAVDISSGQVWSRADRTVYVGSGDGTLYAIDSTTGTERWDVETDAHGLTTAAVAFHGERESNTVFVSTAGDTLYAVGTGAGDVLWTFAPGPPELSPPAVVDSYGGEESGVTVYLSTANGSTYALAGANGLQRWRATTQARTQSTPAVVDGTVYISAGVEYTSNLYALDTTGGVEQWRFELDNQRRLSTPTVVGGTVYVATGSPRIHERTTGSHTSSVYALSDES